MLAFVALAGCATAPDPAKEAEAVRTMPTCSSERECAVKWSAARQWVLANAGWKLQTITPDFLETFNPASGSPELAVRVQKLAQADGTYKIAVRVWCDNGFGCRVPPWDAAIDFNRTVTAAWR
jgi:hypothetical protein